MRVVLQRVKSSRVTVGDRCVGAIDRGLMRVVGIAATDTETELQWMANKCLGLRLFPDAADPDGRWDKSVAEIGGAVLVVSQFTLYGDCRKGRRPSFAKSAAPEIARPLFDRFVALVCESGLKVETGEFGAMMDVEIHNDGPVTLELEREADL